MALLNTYAYKKSKFSILIQSIRLNNVTGIYHVKTHIFFIFITRVSFSYFHICFLLVANTFPPQEKGGKRVLCGAASHGRKFKNWHKNNYTCLAFGALLPGGWRCPTGVFPIPIPRRDPTTNGSAPREILISFLLLEKHGESSQFLLIRYILCP